MKSKFLPIIVLFLFLAACGSPEPTAAPTDAPTDPAPSATTAPTEAPEPTAEPTDAPTAVPEPTEEPEPEQVWIPPMEDLGAISRMEPNEFQITVADFLANVVYPETDFIQEMISHGRLDGPITGFDETENGRLVLSEEVQARTTGSTDSFWIQNNDFDSWNLVEMKLLGVSDHAYFYFDTDRQPDAENVQNAMNFFEAQYEAIVNVYGTPHPLGIDGDPHFFILHPSGTKLCNVTEENSHNCNVGGYFWGINQFPTAVFSHSNEHEGLIMNYDAYTVGGVNYASTLGHEFRHLVEFWFDDLGQAWEAEGSAVMAEDILGFRNSNISFANTFMDDPDVQLNSWPISLSSRSIYHYGQGYVFNRYVYDRFGEAFYSQWVQAPEGGLRGLDVILDANVLEISAEQVWLDWLVALAIFQEEGVPAIYRFADDFNSDLDEVGNSAVGAPPRTVDGEVRQYGVDIFRFLQGQNATVNFTGGTLASLLGTVPASGETFWYSGRSGGSLKTLTLTADLSEVETATLEYAAFFKLSRSFDFAYVVISTDGGQTWQGLVTEDMLGQDLDDDPNEFALVDRFYSANSPGGSWLEQSIDLTDYVGQEVLIRFESDAGNRATGFAIDNIAIPEIGFYDDVESEVAGWTTESWVRAPAYLPQTWELILVTFVDGVPTVTPVMVSADGSANFDVTGLAEGQQAYLIVAATVPHSLVPASYTFSTEPLE